METFKVVLTLGSVDEILWFNHSNETSLAVLSHGTIYIYVFYKMKFGICLEFQCYALLGVKGLRTSQTRACITYYCLESLQKQKIKSNQIFYLFLMLLNVQNRNKSHK